MRKTILNVLFAILAISLVMFVACKNEPVASGAGSITCTLNGVVYDSLANMPVEGAQVDIGTQAVKTDKNGCFALENVAPGSYTISIVKEGYEMETRDVLVDSGRFYNNLSENDKAALTELISNGGEIDDYYVELLFGGERDADEGNPDIDSVGDAKYYGQTVFAVGLTPSNAVLEGAINVKFQHGESEWTYDVPDGVGVTAALVDLLPGAEEPEILRTYRTTVGENGSFRFENIQNGVYYLAVDPMSIALNESTVELDGHIFMEEECEVINGYGTTNTLFYDIQDDEGDPFKLRILSVKAIDRSELPLSSVSRVVLDVSMEAGQAVVIEFNKYIDEDALGTFFRLESEQTQLTGYTKHLIVNGDNGHGYAYVWHDSINSSSILRLWYNVSSFEKGDSLDGSIYLGYHYQLNLKETNLYGYDYDHKLKDGVFKADQPIEIVFDREIPKGSTVEGVLTKHHGGLLIPVPVVFEYDDNVLRAYAALEYRTDFGQNIEDDYYTLKFKITTSEDVVVYNTERGLYKPISGNMILSDDDNSIKFTTAKVEIKYESIDPYDGFFAGFNLDLEGNSAVAYLISSLDGDSEDDDRFIPLNCEIDGRIITATLDEGKALNPKVEYTLHLAVLSERYDVLFTLEEQFEVSDEYFDPLFQNGLEDFTIDGDDYDWDSDVVSFSWTSLGEFLGQPEVYDLYMRMMDDEGEEIDGWHHVDFASFPEISDFEYTYRDKEIEVVDYPALHAGDLLYGKRAQFILVTYDEDGLMIQSPVQVVYDMLGPVTDEEDPYIEPETPYTQLQNFKFTLVMDEEIATVREKDVEVGGAHPEYFDVTWVMNEANRNSVDFTVKALNAPISGYYEEGDLKLTITLRDTSYNQTEKVIDFKN